MAFFSDLKMHFGASGFRASGGGPARLHACTSEIWTFRKFSTRKSGSFESSETLNSELGCWEFPNLVVSLLATFTQKRSFVLFCAPLRSGACWADLRSFADLLMCALLRTCSFALFCRTCVCALLRSFAFFWRSFACLPENFFISDGFRIQLSKNF